MSFLVITGCNTATKGKNKQEFYYFPEKNLYYDVSRKNYLYSMDGGITWNTIKSPLNEDQASLGKKEIIFSDSDSIWLNNQAHLKLYSGNAFNITDIDTSTISSTGDVTEKKIIKKGSNRRVRKKAVQENEKKQPVKDFFKKLFGKHKKKDEA